MNLTENGFRWGEPESGFICKCGTKLEVALVYAKSVKSDVFELYDNCPVCKEEYHIKLNMESNYHSLKLKITQQLN